MQMSVQWECVAGPLGDGNRSSQTQISDSWDSKVSYVVLFFKCTGVRDENKTLKAEGTQAGKCVTCTTEC